MYDRCDCMSLCSVAFALRASHAALALPPRLTRALAAASCPRCPRQAFTYPMSFFVTRHIANKAIFRGDSYKSVQVRCSAAAESLSPRRSPNPSCTRTRMH